MVNPVNLDLAYDSAKIQKFLAGTSFPASHHDLIDAAKKNQAPVEVIEALDSINQGNFSGIEDVLKGYRERDRTAPSDRL